MDGRKIYFNDWLEVLIDNINENIKIRKKLMETSEDKDYHRYYIDREEKLLEKIDMYKKTDEDGNVYLWLFPRELEDISWLLLQNIVYHGLKY